MERNELLMAEQNRLMEADAALESLDGESVESARENVQAAVADLERARE